jgi:hypothetical protein
LALKDPTLEKLVIFGFWGCAGIHELRPQAPRDSSLRRNYELENFVEKVSLPSNVISLERIRSLQAEAPAGSRSVTLRLSGQTLALFNEMEQRLGAPGAMAYFRDGLWVAALAMSHGSSGEKVRLRVEHTGADKRTVCEHIPDDFRLHALRKLV